MKVLRIYFILSIIFSLSLVKINGQNKDNQLLNQQLENVQIESDSLHQVLSGIAVKHRVPIGLENILAGDEPCQLKREIKLNYSKIRIKKLMHSIMTSTTNCDWEIADGVINVFPASGKSDISEITIHNIKLEKRISNQGIKDLIIELPEVKSVLKMDNRNLTTLFTSLSETQPISENFSLHAQDVSLRYILNQIAKNSRSMYWNLSNWENNKSMIFLNF